MTEVVGGIYISLSMATEAEITGMDIFEIRDSITFVSRSKVLSSQNWKRIPLNHAFVLYRAFFRASNK